MTVTLLVAIFTLGYLAITLEHAIKVNKSASALVTGVVCWTVCVMLAPDREPVLQALEQQQQHDQPQRGTGANGRAGCKWQSHLSPNHRQLAGRAGR